MTNLCPTAEELLRYTLEATEGNATAALQRHIMSCDQCRSTVGSMRHAAEALRAHATVTDPESGHCLDEFALVELVAGSPNPERRAEMVAHLSACARCRGNAAAISRVLEEPAIHTEIANVSAVDSKSRKVRVALGGALGFAAAVTLFVIASPLSDEEGATPAHRDATLTASIPPVAVAPTGSVETVYNIIWTSGAGADLYRVTLFDTEGTVLWEAQTRDTFVVVADSVAFQAGVPYFWKVRARTGFDRWSETELVSFTIVTATPERQ